MVVLLSGPGERDGACDGPVDIFKGTIMSRYLFSWQGEEGIALVEEAAVMLALQEDGINELGPP